MPNARELLVIYGLLAMKGALLEPDTRVKTLAGETVALSKSGVHVLFEGQKAPDVFAAVSRQIARNPAPSLGTSETSLDLVAEGSKFVHRGFGFEAVIVVAASPKAVVVLFDPVCEVLAGEPDRRYFGAVATGYRLAILNAAEELGGVNLSEDGTQTLVAQADDLAVLDAATLKAEAASISPPPPMKKRRFGIF